MLHVQGGLEALSGAGSGKGRILRQDTGSCAMISMVPLPKNPVAAGRTGELQQAGMAWIGHGL